MISSSGDANHLDLDVLVAAMSNGKFLYDSSKAGIGGSPSDPPTGFFSGTLNGGFGVLLTIKPAGALAGLDDVLNAQLSVSASSSDWFQSLPTPSIQFQGPDFDAILAKFQSLDFSSIAQALQLILNFVKGLNQPGTAIGDVMSAKLPLINQSLGQILNVASSIADKIQAAITSPAGAIQQLNFVLANAFGLPVPSAVVTETHKGDGGSAEAETVVITADGGTFTLTFRPTGGASETTTPLHFDASPAAVQTALNNLDGVNVTVGGSASNYTVTFTSNGQRPVFVSDATELARGPPLLTWNNGEVDFTFDLNTSTSLTRPFDLDLSSITNALPGPLAGIANALIGASAGGNISLTAGADLHVALGLELGQHLDVTGGTAHTTLRNNATGGTFTISYNGNTSSALAYDVTADASPDARSRGSPGSAARSRASPSTAARTRSSSTTPSTCRS